MLSSTRLILVSKDNLVGNTGLQSSHLGNTYSNSSLICIACGFILNETNLLSTFFPQNRMLYYYHYSISNSTLNLCCTKISLLDNYQVNFHIFILKNPTWIKSLYQTNKSKLLLHFLYDSIIKHYLSIQIKCFIYLFGCMFVRLDSETTG